ncbi:hypothetical protein [Bradyrhizobium cenepequi]|uniref:hypothetical protein n=1 Tax=Bradyrhizobium cenepequi TaxID=2821403 RepID=UPI001CE270B0|nr:hypothetical protein [Bradyrhizobium cenepequi]MCA6108362.1 hypothetical protein [Bradyrhizobium cenepequi]
MTDNNSMIPPRDERNPDDVDHEHDRENRVVPDQTETFVYTNNMGQLVIRQRHGPMMMLGSASQTVMSGTIMDRDR